MKGLTERSVLDCRWSVMKSCVHLGDALSKWRGGGRKRLLLLLKLMLQRMVLLYGGAVGGR